VFSSTQLLPTTKEYKYKTDTFWEIDSAAETFKAVFSINVQTQSEFMTWKQAFQSKTNSQFTIRTTRPTNDNKYVFSQYLRCHHNVHRGKVGKFKHKHTACPTQMNVKIVGECSAIDSKYPCIVNLTWNHNHPIHVEEVVRRQTVNPETNTKLLHLYDHGHTPRSALHYIRIELEDTLGEDECLDYKLATRSICPDYHHCQYIFKNRFGLGHIKQDVNVPLAEFISSVNVDMDERCIVHEEYVVDSTSDSRFIIAMCTPFMKRVHSHMKEAGEVVFVESSGGFDRDRYRIYLFMTHCKSGGNKYYLINTTCQSIIYLFVLACQMCCLCVLAYYKFYNYLFS